jgi:hypothetical protein
MFARRVGDRRRRSKSASPVIRIDFHRDIPRKR